jgi:hypothetical protein
LNMQQGEPEMSYHSALEAANEHQDGREPYVAPEVRQLGTLAELTSGGTVGPDDGFGGAGDSGSLP